MALASFLPMTWNSSPWPIPYPVFAIIISAKRYMTGVWCSITNCDRDHVRRLMPCRLCRWRACLSLRRRLSTRILASKACREREDYASSLLSYPQALSTYTTPSGHAIIMDSAHMYSIRPRSVALFRDLHGWDNPYGHTAETPCTR